MGRIVHSPFVAVSFSSMSEDLLSLPVLPADHRIPYGRNASQFGDLWIPDLKPKALCPLVVFFHGGWWKSAYDLGYAGRLCAAFKAAGIACWSVEYRRVGNLGGGWPGTFLDAAAGFDFIEQLAERFPLDLTRVVTMGHSAGGHLAFWIAGRHHIAPSSELFRSHLQIKLRGSISLAGAVDLRLLLELATSEVFAHDKEEVVRLMGGQPRVVPDRYRAGNPGDLLPFSAPQILVQGTLDDQIPPELPQQWVEASRRSGSRSQFHLMDGLDHFDVVDPTTSAWPLLLRITQSLLLA